jgi:hypothetical protein
MVVYLVFLTLSLLLLIDRRNALKSDRVLDMLHKPFAAPPSEQEGKP